MEVIVYKLSSCGFCKVLLQTLDGGGVNYIVRSSTDPENREDCEKMDTLFGTRRYPKVVLKQNDETVFIVSNDANPLPEVEGVKFFYYSTPQDILDVIKKQNEQ